MNFEEMLVCKRVSTCRFGVRKQDTYCMSRDLIIGDDVFILEHVVSLAGKSNFLCLHLLRYGLDN